MNNLEQIKKLIELGDKYKQCHSKDAKLCWAVRCNLGKECKHKQEYKIAAFNSKAALKELVAENERMREALKAVREDFAERGE